MLYILQSCILLIWLIYVVRKEKYSAHALVTTYLFFMMIVDVLEIIFNQLLGFYKFPTHLFTDILKDNQMGIVFSDGLILPMTGMILCHYATKTKKLWSLAFIFASAYGLLELLYLKLGYLVYYRWNICFSISIYFFVSRLVSNYASRLMLYKPPLPYFIRIGTSTYTATAWFGVLGHALIRMYQWRPHVFESISADDRFGDLVICYIFAFLSALIIPKIKTHFRPLIFITFAMLAIAFWIFAYYRGWLIYHKWNNILTMLRWIIPFLFLIWLDKWESKINS